MVLTDSAGRFGPARSDADFSTIVHAGPPGSGGALSEAPSVGTPSQPSARLVLNQLLRGRSGTSAAVRKVASTYTA